MSNWCCGFNVAANLFGIVDCVVGWVDTANTCWKRLNTAIRGGKYDSERPLTLVLAWLSHVFKKHLSTLKSNNESSFDRISTNTHVYTCTYTGIYIYIYRKYGAPQRHCTSVIRNRT